MVHHRAGWLDPVFEALSYAGRFGLVWIAIALVATFVYRRWGALALTVVVIGLSDALAAGLKVLADRPRPFLRYPEPEPLVRMPHDGSFPSGHAATSFAAATVLSLAFPMLRLPLWLLAAAIAFSRVYVGVHYPLDILGGAILGVLVAAASAGLMAGRGRRVFDPRALRPPAGGRRL